MAKINKMATDSIEIKKLYKGYVVDTVASYFGVGKANIRNSMDWDADILTFPMLKDPFNFRHCFYTGHFNIKSINLLGFFDPKFIVKTPFIEGFLIGEMMADAEGLNDYVFNLNLKGSNFAVYRGSLPAEAASLIVDTTEGEFVITPLRSFLGAHYPKSSVD